MLPTIRAIAIAASTFACFPRARCFRIGDVAANGTTGLGVQTAGRLLEQLAAGPFRRSRAIGGNGMKKVWLALPLALGIGVASAHAQTKEVTFAHQDMIVPMRALMASGELE